MEPSSHGKGQGNVAVVEMPVQWLDVGSWTAWPKRSTDEHNNAVERKNRSVHRFGRQHRRQFRSRASDQHHRRERYDHRAHERRHHDLPQARTQRVKDLVGKVKEKFGTKFD